MRKLILLSVLAVALASCSNVGKYKDAIESLSSDWESTTSQVTAVVDQINQAQAQAKSALEGMNPSEEVVAAFTDEQKTKLASLKQAVQGQMSDLGALSQQAFEFVSKWQEEGQKLTALKDGLASGKLPGDVQATIDSLKGLIGTAKENATTWAGKVESAQTTVASATQSYNSLVGGMAQ
ncbi:MAG: hypothetical protein KDD10_05625 [Phaeodactylibacter sp.]|nr:hypothetical protein [Phaeodactylibacter sp.]MCB9298804.1 hypothetical protein [Lewinellaceae bacterium]